MRNYKALTSSVVGGLMAALLLAGCGGGSSVTTPGDVGQGSGNIPGQQTNGSSGGSGTGAGGGGYSNGPNEYSQFLSKIEGASEEAPLGLTTLYKPELVTGAQESFTPTRDLSAVIIDPPSQLLVLDIVMTDDGQTPDWAVERAVFEEGQHIDIWMQYQVPAAGNYSRRWKCPDISLDLLESNINHPNSGQYEIKIDYVIPWGTAKQDCTYDADIISSSQTVHAPTFYYDILADSVTSIVRYPVETGNNNDNQGNGGGCLPNSLNVTVNSTNVVVSSDKDINTVVLNFTDGTRQRFDDLSGLSGTWAGSGANSGKSVAGAWVYAGCNISGAGANYGEYFTAAGQQTFMGMAQMGFEDLLTGSDYDYNDLVIRMNAVEFRNADNDLVQIVLVFKGVARAAGYDGEWQFNMDAAFPGASVIAIVDQYYSASGLRHGNQRVWKSSQGASVPIFSPNRNALPNPPGSYATNGIKGTKFIDGDYAVVTIVFDTPVHQGSYTPMPYLPQLKVLAGGSNNYTIPLWKQKGDWLDSNGRPLAFIVPDTYAWPLEGKKIWYSYPGYNTWIQWLNNQISVEPTPHFWDTTPVKDTFLRSDFTN